MFKKTTLTVTLSMLFALAVAMPASATETETTTEVVTTAVTTSDAPTTTTAPKGKMSLELLLAQMRAKIASKKASSTKATTTKEFKGDRALGTSLKNVDASCIVKLVDAREVSIQNSWATFNTSMSDALKARHTALVAAWGKEVVADRTADIKTAMKTWQDAHKAMFTKLKTDKKAAWATFKSKAKAECKVSVPAEEKLSTDGAGTVAL